jgi:hypothetical protein
MTAEEELPGRLELDVGDPATPVPGLPDGHLRVVWSDYTHELDSGKFARYCIGAFVLAALLALMLRALSERRAA